MGFAGPYFRRREPAPTEEHSPRRQTPERNSGGASEISYRATGGHARRPRGCRPFTRWTLRGRDLTGAILTGCNLEKANFRGAKLGSADLSQSNLRRADLRSCDLTETKTGSGGLKRGQHQRYGIVPRGSSLGHPARDHLARNGAASSQSARGGLFRFGSHFGELPRN